jgi:cytochrome P450
LTATGVPYVERVLEKDCTISGSLLKGGDRIRLVLGAYQKAGVSDERNESKLYFGIGRHTCLGKMLSVKAWKVLVGKLQTINRSVEISSISYRISDSVFSCPISFRVRCHDGSR